MNLDVEELGYAGCHWHWNENYQGIQCVRPRDHHMAIEDDSNQKRISIATVYGAQATDMRFREAVDALDHIRFKRHIQRKCKPNEKDVVRIQDVKDVVLYITDNKNLTLEFIDYFHLATMDRYLRCLIVYFQQFIRIWEACLVRRDIAKTSVEEIVISTEVEAKMCNELSDIRSLVAREYSFLILGTHGAMRFHHIGKREKSLADRDRRLFEVLMQVAARVVWVALHRHSLIIIENELNRLHRAQDFLTSRLQVTKAEEKIFYGTSDVKERSIMKRSPMIKELLVGTHDHRLLACGVTIFPPEDRRAFYLEAACFAPEEELQDLGIEVGILGMPRASFDAMLNSLDIYKLRAQVKFELPPVSEERLEGMPETYPKVPPRYKQIQPRSEAQKKQHNLWRDRLVRLDPSISSGFSSVRAGSVFTLSTRHSLHE